MTFVNKAKLSSLSIHLSIHLPQKEVAGFDLPLVPLHVFEDELAILSLTAIMARRWRESIRDLGISTVGAETELLNNKFCTDISEQLQQKGKINEDRKTI